MRRALGRAQADAGRWALGARSRRPGELQAEHRSAGRAGQAGARGRQARGAGRRAGQAGARGAGQTSAGRARPGRARPGRGWGARGLGVGGARAAWASGLALGCALGLFSIRFDLVLFLSRFFGHCS